MKRHHAARGTLVIAAVAATAFVAAAPLQPTNDSCALDPGTAGMWVHIDDETGDLQAGPTPSATTGLELDADTQNALRRDTEGLEMIHHANGAVSMNLQGRYQSVSVIRIDQNGVATICADNETSVEHARKGQPRSAAPEVK